jgi:hypothetical protein
MDDDYTKKPNSIAPVSSHGIVRAALDNLVRRGLDDLALRDVKWIRKRIPELTTPFSRISPSGLIAMNYEGSWDKIHRTVILNPETGRTDILGGPLVAYKRNQVFDWQVLRDMSSDIRSGIISDVVDCFAWSPCSRFLLTRSREPSWPVRLYDTTSHGLIDFVDFGPHAVAWSPKRTYVATVSRANASPMLALFRVEDLTHGAPSFMQGGKGETKQSSKLDDSYFYRMSREFFAGRGEFTPDSFYGFSHPEFSPEESLLAVSAVDRLAYPREGTPEKRVDFIEEAKGPKLKVSSIVALKVPMLRQAFRVEVPSEVTSMSWASDGRLIACCGGEVYCIDPKAPQPSKLSIQARVCRCHPTRDICAFGEHEWHTGDSSSRLSVLRLNPLNVITEKATGPIQDITWGIDGRKLYVLSGTEDFWTCTLPPM